MAEITQSMNKEPTMTKRKYDKVIYELNQILWSYNAIKDDSHYKYKKQEIDETIKQLESAIRLLEGK